LRASCRFDRRIACGCRPRWPAPGTLRYASTGRSRGLSRSSSSWAGICRLLGGRASFAALRSTPKRAGTALGRPRKKWTDRVGFPAAGSTRPAAGGSAAAAHGREQDVLTADERVDPGQVSRDGVGPISAVGAVGAAVAHFQPVRVRPACSASCPPRPSSRSSPWTPCSSLGPLSPRRTSAKGVPTRLSTATSESMPAPVGCGPATARSTDTAVPL
jgi:hypothetical protein